jgi:succinate dehydrogenase/fumarate reductase flavoprotein subunit
MAVWKRIYGMKAIFVIFSRWEVNGTFGVYRPGGSALNSTQVSSFRAAQYIAQNYNADPMSEDDFTNLSKIQINDLKKLADCLTENINNTNVLQLKNVIRS